jgi:hypothetical protein
LIEDAVIPALAEGAPDDPEPPGEQGSLWRVFRRAYRGARARQRLGAEASGETGKESLGPTVEGWSKDASPGKQRRVAYLRDLLGLPEVLPDGLRYQLLHRTAAAILEARRFVAPHAAMVVHSFSAGNEGFEDFRTFARLLGAGVEPGRLVQVPGRAGPTLHLGWAADVGG